MDCKDLMIGDFVNVNGLNLKVGAIHADEIGVFDPDYKIYWCSDDGLDRIDPIPLTEKILVKNGFDFTKRNYGVCCKEDEYGDVELSKDENGFYWSINTDEYEILRINYVHTLQHLLRLCGVEKELTI